MRFDKLNSSLDDEDAPFDMLDAYSFGLWLIISSSPDSSDDILLWWSGLLFLIKILISGWNY